LNQSITTSAVNAFVRLASAVRPDGRRTDNPGGACLRHLLAVAERQHHFHWHANRRRGCQPGDCADVVPEAEDPDKDILLYINSSGGSITASLAIYDTMQFIRPAVQTYGIGQAASMAAVRLAAGTKGKRFSLPNSRIVIHQPLMFGLAGQATDIDIAATDILRMQERINDILALHSGQPVKWIEEDTERDDIMTAEQGKEYGILDEVIRKRASGACAPGSQAFS
jgi:ATP-dependent Clp protease protease subunit